MIAPPEHRELDALPFAAGYAALGERFVEPRRPAPLSRPYLVAFNPDAAALLDLDPAAGATPAFLAVAAGNALPPGADPTAAVYAGHQFGVWVARLGDGRAITLGEVRNARGERWEWQLKGAGMTAFSRFADGRAVLRSTIREYLCSEAMHALRIPTTRALAIAGSPDPVLRETRETAAVLSRLAPSHVRFGTFEYFRHRGDDASLRTLADYVIAGFFPEIDATGGDRYARLLQAVVESTARLVAQWQAAGFAHGVMNTDNMSILGLTLDYGPFGFMEAYEPGFVCNHSDAGGRYAFDRQPGVALWNCHALAAALDGLVPGPDAEAALAAFEPTYRDGYVALMRQKLGLQGARDGDARIVVDLLAILAAARADYTRFFRALCGLRADDAPETCAAGAELGDAGVAWPAWVARYRERFDGGLPDAERAAAMRRVNPKYVLRNYLAQTAIERAQAGDFSELATLHGILATPFDEQPQHDAYASAPPAEARHIVVSCSS
jgi:uncharacterized protein YdiU (UPF0061 family)